LQLISKDIADVLAELSHTAGRGCHVTQLIEATDELPSSHVDKLWKSLDQAVRILGMPNANAVITMALITGQAKSC
jgi:hypothetical protein